MNGLHPISLPEHHPSSNKIVSNKETYVPRRGEDVRTKPLMPPQTVERPLPLRTRVPKKRLKNRIKYATLLDRPLFSSLLALSLLAAIVVIIVYFIWDTQRQTSPSAFQQTPPTLPTPSSTNAPPNNTLDPPQRNNDLPTEQPLDTVPSSTRSDTASSPLQTADPPLSDQTILPDSPSETLIRERIYTVQPGDTLYRIAMKTYGNKASIETIRAANGLKNNTIYVGQQLKLPSTSSLP